ENEWYNQCLPRTPATIRPTSTTGGVGTATDATFQNPIKPSQGPDPFMVYDNGYYYLMTTTGSDVQISRGTSMTALKAATPKLVWSDKTPNRCCSVWAPEVHKISGKWWLYYSAGLAGNWNHENQWVHVLEGGSSPWDTYTYRGRLEPTNAPDAWAIDGSILTVNGALYLVFAGVSPAGLQSLFIAPMSNAYTVGERSLLSEPTDSWERQGFPVNEGPAPLYKGGVTYLAFSASSCRTAGYSLGLLKYNGGTVTSSSSWTKSGPHFTSANGHYGPGHNAFFTSPNGSIYNVYHATAKTTGACDGSRYTMVQPLTFQSDGVTPNFGVPRPLSDNIPEPQ
ncbi:hypothetical protein FRC03_006052, partial [Tulasnella sp. 419]